jgi:hypothetical protein
MALKREQAMVASERFIYYVLAATAMAVALIEY